MLPGSAVAADTSAPGAAEYKLTMILLPMEDPMPHRNQLLATTMLDKKPDNSIKPTPLRSAA